jgi:maltose alpha-D-glucosyltransferase/alpha-amylase
VPINNYITLLPAPPPPPPLAERRRKQSVLRDVAGMLRSFNYAQRAALLRAGDTPEEIERLSPLARSWEEEVRQTFMRAYGDEAVRAGAFGSAEEFEAAGAMLQLFEVEKAFYELRYELQNRPDWVAVPLAAVTSLAELTSEA